MAPVDEIEFLIGLLAVVGLLALLARLIGVPYPIFLVLGGLGLGLRVERYEAGLEAGQITEEYQESSAAWSRWRRELFEAERAAILSLRDEGKISAEVMRRVERDIDLEELRFSG